MTSCENNPTHKPKLEEFGLIGIQVWKSCGEEIERLKEEREKEIYIDT